MKTLRMIAGISAVMVLLLAACGRSDDSENVATTTAPVGVATTTTEQDPCAGETLESSEIGVSSSEITVVVMADIGSDLAPGLFQGSIDGAKAWVEYINSQGGLACRTVRLIEHDSAINPVETTNGFLTACDEALGMVGSSALLAFNVEAQRTCDDMAGNPTGVPDFPERATETGHACSPNTFSTAGTNAACPPPEGDDQTRTYSVNRIIDKYIIDTHGDDLHGVFAIPSDLTSAINASMAAIRYAGRVSGIDNDGEFGVSGGAEQAFYGTLLATMRQNDSNFARTGSNDDSILKWRREAQAQGGFEDVIWSCSLACYTPGFIEEGNLDITEGTYVWMSFIPFAEREHNEELDLFINQVGTDFPPAWAAGAWAAGRLFEQVINDVVAEYGLNGITRERVIAAAQGISSFDANGWFGNIDFTAKPNLSPCVVVLRQEGGEFVRKFPEEPGTLDCTPSNIGTIDIDAPKAFADGPP